MSLPTFAQVKNWIQGKNQDKAVAWVERVKGAVVPRVQDMAKPMLAGRVGQVGLGKFELATSIERVGAQIQGTTDKRGTVTQVGVFGADLAPGQLVAIAKERTRLAQLKQQRQLADRVQLFLMDSSETSEG